MYIPLFSSLSRPLSCCLSLFLSSTSHACVFFGVRPSLFLSLPLPVPRSSDRSINPCEGGPCTTADNCRFDYDLCVDSICKVNPSVQEDASEKTTVTVTTNAYDTRDGDNNGCGESGCLAELTRDGNTADPESRWSCSKNLGEGNCYLEYTFGSPQDVISLNIAFHKGDERTRKIKVCVWNWSVVGQGVFMHGGEEVLKTHSLTLDRPSCFLKCSFEIIRALHFPAHSVRGMTPSDRLGKPWSR